MFSFPSNQGHIALPVVYLRFGDLPMENGKFIPSKNHLINRMEKGLSVYPAWYCQEKDMYVLPSGHDQFLSTQENVIERPALLVSGTDIGMGGDDEPVLDINTVKVLKVVSPSKIVTEMDREIDISGNSVPDEKVPWFPGEREALDQHQAAYSRAAEERSKQQAERHRSLMDAMRQFLQINPNYREQFEKSYPELRGL